MDRKTDRNSYGSVSPRRDSPSDARTQRRISPAANSGNAKNKIHRYPENGVLSDTVNASRPSERTRTSDNETGNNSDRRSHNMPVNNGHQTNSSSSNDRRRVISSSSEGRKSVSLSNRNSASLPERRHSVNQSSSNASNVRETVRRDRNVRRKNDNIKNKAAHKKIRFPRWMASAEDYEKKEDIIRIKGSFDRPMLIIVLVLIGFGLIMVFSASYAYALSKTGDSLYYIKHQLAFAVLGIGAMIFMMNLDYRIIYKFTVPAFVITSILLVITPVYGLAAGVATRWIEIGGVRFQPSEIMKLVLVLFLARYYSIYEKPAHNYADFWQSSVYGLFIPAGFVLFVCLLIMLENHFSCMIIMFLIGMCVIFAAGARKFWFIIAGSSAAVAAVIAISFSGYARQRVDVWLHPENYSAQDEVYQTLQGLYAVGSGGLFGTGLGNSRQKHLFVSQPQNDFIFSIVAEELGFIGAVGLIALFVLLVWRGIVIALRTPDTFSQLVVIGIVSKVAIQALLNIGVVTAILPNTGISLPFFSYGGTALAMQIAEMGIVLGISRYSRRQT